jgi:hypothetical protein
MSESPRQDHPLEYAAHLSDFVSRQKLADSEAASLASDG